jgi:hypothetical protein
MLKHYLAICAIFRDEAPYLAEWIIFHQLMGVEHFYLYNNNSTDDFKSVLKPFVAKGYVTLHDWPIPFHEYAQKKAYAHCLEHVRGKTRWLACIDIDEFLFSPVKDNLTEMLVEYELYPGVVVHWQVYGSGGLRQKTDDPVIARFTKRAPTNWIRNRKIKSIVDPSRTIQPLGIHHFSYIDGALPVDESKTRVSLKHKPTYKKKFKWLYGKLGPLLRYFDPYPGTDINSRLISVERLRINHYPIKSYEEFLKKTAHKKEKRRYEDVDYFTYHDRNEITDTVLHKYLPGLYRLMDSTGKLTGQQLQ